MTKVIVSHQFEVGEVLVSARAPFASRFVTWLSLLSCLVAMPIAGAGESDAAPRKALVIANADYKHMSKLLNPENDGRLIESKLKATGFDVRSEHNLTGPRLSQVLHEFARGLTPDTEAVVYYAGHGIQFGGNSLMVGVDATLSSESALYRETHGLLELTELLERRAGIALIFWDACRDNPLSMEQQQLLASGTSLPLRAGGAQWPERHSTGNSIVMYATYPGKAAKDGAGSNSPFALALARNMTTPNQGIGEFLRSVAADVRAQTNNAQLPQVVSGQPDREFVFHAVGASSIAEKQDYEAEIRRLREQVALLSSQVGNTRRIRVVSAGDATPKGATTRPETWTDMGGDRAVEKGGAKDEFQAVEILFGTSRKMESARQTHGRERLVFSGVDDNRLTLGKTIVTIPRNRARGTLSRPIFGIEGFISIQFRPENPAWDFTIQRVTQLNGDEFGKEVDWKITKSARYKGQVLVFVHGYNTGFDDAMYRAAQLAHDLDFDGPTVAFSWPSYARALGYLHDSSTVETSGRWLHDLLVLISRRTKATTINLVAHSMGNRAVLSALNYAAIAGTSLALNEFVLAAPDVGRTEFTQKADLIRRYVKGATMYASANDRALTLSRQLRYAEIAVAGHVPPPPDAPVVEPGVDTIDVTDANTSLFFTNHTTFAERRHLMRDMQLLFTGAKRPPDARNPFLLPTPGTHGAPIYWRYVPN